MRTAVSLFSYTLYQCYASEWKKIPVWLFIWWCSDNSNNNKWMIIIPTINERLCSTIAKILCMHACLRVCVFACLFDSLVKRGSIGGGLIASECRTNAHTRTHWICSIHTTCVCAFMWIILKVIAQVINSISMKKQKTSSWKQFKAK